MNGRKILPIFLFGLIILVLFNLSSVCTGETGVTVGIEDNVVESGSVITIPVMIYNITDFGAATIKIYYDSDIFVIEDVSSGDCGSLTYSLGTDADANVLEISSFVADMPGPEGDLVFAKIKASVIGSEGESQLVPDVDVLVHSDGSSISYKLRNGLYTITTSESKIASSNGGSVATPSEEVKEVDGGGEKTGVPDATRATEKMPSSTTEEVPGFGAVSFVVALMIVSTSVAILKVLRTNGR